MRKILLYTMMACGFGSAVLAQSVTVQVVALNQRDNGNNMTAPDVCTVVVKAQNGTPALLGLELEVLPTYISGSSSAFVAPAGTAFGHKNKIGFFGLEAGVTFENDVSILGAICDDMETLELVPRCQEVDGTLCNAVIVLSAQSVIGVQIAGGETFGGRAAVDIGPVGPLHGQIEIKTAASGQLVMVFNLVHPIKDSATGTYTATPAICEAAGLQAGCELGQKTGDRSFARVVNEMQASAGARMADYDEGRVSFHWDLTTGLGFMRNMAGTVNLPIVVEITP